MQFSSADISTRSAYRLLTGAITPRPVAWIATVGTDGRSNLAPFSAFTLVAPSPPMVGFTVGPKKDTCRNVEATGEFVVNIPGFDLVDAVHDSSAEFPPEESEIEALGLATVASTVVAPPRIAATPVQFECRVDQIHRHGRLGTRFVVGEVLVFHVDDRVLEPDGGTGPTIRPRSVDPIGVLAGGDYCRVGDHHHRAPLHGARNPWGTSYPERTTST